MTALIAELKALKEKATPGPWQVQDGCSWRRIGTSGNDGDVICPTNHPSDNHPDLYSARGGDIYANLNFIVALVNHLPTILAKLEEGERMREALEKLEAAELAHANCDLCDGEGIPELCEQCFPKFDDARLARRAALEPAHDHT